MGDVMPQLRFQMEKASTPNLLQKQSDFHTRCCWLSPPGSTRLNKTPPGKTITSSHLRLLVLSITLCGKVKVWHCLTP